MKRVFLLVLDSFGIGHAPDAYKFDDVGANTFGHIMENCYYKKNNNNKFSTLNIPNLISLGLGNIYKKITGKSIIGMNNNNDIISNYGYAHEISSAKDTTSGHWEIAGAPVLFQWDFFHNKKNSFSKILLKSIIMKLKLPGILGNCHASGTEILNKFGELHLQTNKPIFYTSSDSVFQVCCHEEKFGLNNLYKLCKNIRKILNENHINIARVIARPFIGDKKKFIRTGNRKDFSQPPHKITVLQKLIQEKNGNVIAIGKISDIFANIGITKKISSHGLQNLVNDTISVIQSAKNNTLVFVNFIDFDSLWGHRRDVFGYAKGLELFDTQIPKILHSLCDEDILIITADHGCDPTWFGSDHTREYIPIILYNRFNKNKFLGYRKTFSDIGQTIAKYFSLSPMKYGISMI